MRVSPNVKRTAAGIIAAAAWLALALQLAGMIGTSLAAGTPVTNGLIVYVSLFTIQANCLVAVLMTLALLRPQSQSPLLRASVMSGAAVYIVITGLLYYLYLYGFLHPRGFMVLPDILLHAAIPALFLTYWVLVVPKGTLTWKHALVWMIYPVIYLGYVFIVGKWTGHYSYPPLDASMLKRARVLRHAAVFLIYFLAFGMILVALDRWMRTKSVGNR
jgi:hypothetical protein